MHFPVANIDLFPLWPPLVALAISFFTSMAGVSGAFLLLPFQVSVLGFNSPAVSPTNLIFNVVAIPGGVYRYLREGRMAWPLAWVVVIGTLPGVFIGAVLRIRYLPDPTGFKLFVGCVLLYIGARLLLESSGLRKADPRLQELEDAFQQRYARSREAGPSGKKEHIRTIRISLQTIEYEFYGERFSFAPGPLFLLAFVVGIIGGTYGIGGGAIIAPFLITFFALPIYTIAGAALLGTFITSVAGVASYYLIARHYADTGLAIRPDWLLGLLFGLGGLAGTYLGARAQKYVPARAIKLILSGSICYLAANYILKFFL